jgi:hypothetical protein
LLLVGVVLMGVRRFFVFPWRSANEWAEMLNEQHEFSWRMKSKVYDGRCHCKMIIGNRMQDISEYFEHVRDVELLYQEIQHRLQISDMGEISIYCEFWLSVNGSPFFLVVDPGANLVDWKLPAIYFDLPHFPVLPPVQISSHWRQASVAVRARLQEKVGNRIRVEEFVVHAGLSIASPADARGIYCLGEMHINGELCGDGDVKKLIEPTIIRGGDSDAVFLAVFSL